MEGTGTIKKQLKINVHVHEVNFENMYCEDPHPSWLLKISTSRSLNPRHPQAAGSFLVTGGATR